MSSSTKLIQNCPNESTFDLPPLSLAPEGIAHDFKHYYVHTFGRDRDCLSAYYPYRALATTLRDRLMERWKTTRQAYDETGCKRAYYLSLEFLMGRALSNATFNLDLDVCTPWGWSWRRSPRPSPIRVWATAAWAGSPPASSTPAPHCNCRCAATGCATNTACSARRSRTAPRSRNRTTGCARAIPGRSSAPSSPSASSSAATPRPTAIRTDVSS